MPARRVRGERRRAGASSEAGRPGSRSLEPRFRHLLALTALPIVVVALAAVAVVLLAWGWFEAGWVRLRTLDVRVPGLPPELDGLRIVHLSDFHLGLPSRGVVAVERAAAWARERSPDLTLVTGDLVSRTGGEGRLQAVVAGLPNCYAILGNHDVDQSRDPFAQPTRIEELDRVELLLDEGRELRLRGRTVWLAGLDPESRGREPDLSRAADFSILLSHFPCAFDRIEPGSFDLVLSGHMHDGQICLPYPGGKLRLAHPRAAYTHGLYVRAGTTMHVSPGLGTTFVPFRFCARPEATELVIHSGD
jgi:predicted MPP superfamily phosphohydrolase